MLGQRKTKVLCRIMMINIFICLLVGVMWKVEHNRGTQKRVRIPSQRFWHRLIVSESFWNKEQQRLDVLNNPLINSELSRDSLVGLADWLNDTGPLDPCEVDYRVPRQILDYNTLPNHFQDFLLHMRCRMYPMLINQPHICDKNPFLLLVVKSRIPHFDRRQAIRQTWGQTGFLASRTVATVFLLGSTSSVDNLPELQEMINHEAKLHNDLLQWDYRDTFFNLTLKEVLFQEWFRSQCPHAQYILKGDDDVFVNTLNIIHFLKGLSEGKDKDLFIGDVIENARPHRNKQLKYFVPESFFVGLYPPYAGGGGYLLSGNLAIRLYNISQQVVLYPIDDVYTGMCMKKLGLVPLKHTAFKTFGIEAKYRDNPCIYRSLMLVHSLMPQEILKIWPWIVHPELDCQ